MAGRASLTIGFGYGDSFSSSVSDVTLYAHFPKPHYVAKQVHCLGGERVPCEAGALIERTSPSQAVSCRLRRRRLRALHCRKRLGGEDAGNWLRAF
jgi:hypothetical protein